MDIFGDSDPKMMPEHFFYAASSIRYQSAIRAEIEKQNYSVAPRHWYIDASFDCDRCAQQFDWTADEQKTWFEDYCFWVDSLPRHCPTCRTERRNLSELRKEYDATIAATRNHGTTAEKHRIIQIVNELENALRSLPDKMIETAQLFERQTKKRG